MSTSPLQIVYLLLVLLGGPAVLSAQDRPFAVGERLTYRAEFGWISAGTSTIQIAGRDTLAGRTALHFISETRTNEFFDHLYRVRNRVEFRVDAATLSLLSLTRDISEGSYRRRDTSIVDRDGRIFTGHGDTLSAAEPVFDALGAVYHLRTLPLRQGDVIHLKIYDGKRLRNIAVTVDGNAEVTVPAGEFKCLVLNPVSRDERQLTRAEGRLRVWLTADEQRLPVRIEQKARYGTMVLKLSEIELGDRPDH